MKLPAAYLQNTHLRKTFKILGGIFAILIALNMGWIRPMNRYRGIAESKATGLGAISEYPEYQSESRLQAAAYLTIPELPQSKIRSNAARKITRVVSLSLSVPRPLDAASTIRRITNDAGGYVTKSEAFGSGNSESANLDLRIPAQRLDDVRRELKSLAKEVLSEVERADDVTKQYVDTSASLRNLQAEEAQYLQILRRANSVKDVIEVTGKLSEVRRNIDSTQSEFDALSQQAELCLVSVSLQTKQDLKILGIEWHPGWELKWGMRSGLESLASYVNSMLLFLFHMPSIALWTLTVIVGGALAWRILKVTFRLVFGLGR